jgi:hypothetical protein
MCAGAILLDGIPRMAVGENVTFMGAQDLLRAADVEVEVRQDAECVRIMREFIEKIWSSGTKILGADAITVLGVLQSSTEYFKKRGVEEARRRESAVECGAFPGAHAEA